MHRAGLGLGRHRIQMGTNGSGCPPQRWKCHSCGVTAPKPPPKERGGQRTPPPHTHLCTTGHVSIGKLRKLINQPKLQRGNWGGLILIQTKNPSGNQRGGLSVGSGDPRSPQSPHCVQIWAQCSPGGALSPTAQLWGCGGGGGLHPDPPTAPSCPEQGEEGRYCLAAGRGGGGGREEGTARPRGGGGGGEGRHGGE